MSYRSSIGSAYGGGRASPYTSTSVPRLTQQDRSISDLFEYVDAGDIAPPRGSVSYSSAPLSEDQSAPDVIHVKYMGQAYRLEFPPYSISESGVTVEEVRRRIADGLEQDARRVRLVYKDRELRFDPWPIKKYGCKQNSELAVVVTERLNDWGGGADNQPSSGDDSGSGSSLRPPTDQKRPRGMSTVRYRSNDGYKVEEVRRSVADSSGFLNPNGSAHHERRRSISPARSKDQPNRSTDRVSATPTPSATPRPPRADPKSPLGKVQALQDLYYDTWLPESESFLNSPPTDPAQREREYRRLSESVMKHVVEAADAIELQGDQTARVERKRVLSDAQALLQKLDAVQKPK